MSIRYALEENKEEYDEYDDEGEEDDYDDDEEALAPPHTWQIVFDTLCGHRKLLLACFLVICVGVVAGVYFEGWTWLTSLYVITQIVTTVGYGDVTVNSDAMKLFMALYVLASLVIVAHFLNLLTTAIIEHHSNKMKERLKRLELEHIYGDEAHHLHTNATIEFKTRRHRAIRRDLCIHVLFFFGMLAAGTAFYRWSEACSCSYGTTAGSKPFCNDTAFFHHAEENQTEAELEGLERDIVQTTRKRDECESTFEWGLADQETISLKKMYKRRSDLHEGKSRVFVSSYEHCMLTGGWQINTVQAFYMSTITATTVGFGDYSPKSRWGRAFAIVWMVLAVASTGFFLNAMATLLDGQQEVHYEGAKDIEKSFKRMDMNGNGALSRAEYRCFVLLKHGMVSEETIEEIDFCFDKITGGRESVTLEQVHYMVERGETLTDDS